MTTQYVFASHVDEASRFFQIGRSVSDSIVSAGNKRELGRTKLFKAVTKTVPGKAVWRAWFMPIPEGTKVRWVECFEPHDQPAHEALVSVRYETIHEQWCETPGLWRYPIVEQLTASTTTTTITELK